MKQYIFRHTRIMLTICPFMMLLREMQTRRIYSRLTLLNTQQSSQPCSQVHNASLYTPSTAATSHYALSHLSPSAFAISPSPSTNRPIHRLSLLSEKAQSLPSPSSPT